MPMASHVLEINRKARQVFRRKSHGQGCQLPASAVLARAALPSLCLSAARDSEKRQQTSPQLQELVERDPPRQSALLLPLSMRLWRWSLLLIRSAHQAQRICRTLTDT